MHVKHYFWTIVSKLKIKTYSKSGNSVIPRRIIWNNYATMENYIENLEKKTIEMWKPHVNWSIENVSKSILQSAK